MIILPNSLLFYVGVYNPEILSYIQYHITLRAVQQFQYCHCGMCNIHITR